MIDRSDLTIGELEATIVLLGLDRAATWNADPAAGSVASMLRFAAERGWRATVAQDASGCVARIEGVPNSPVAGRAGNPEDALARALIRASDDPWVSAALVFDDDDETAAAAATLCSAITGNRPVIANGRFQK